MRFFACHTCLQGHQIGGDLQEVQSLLGSEKSFSCITPLCGGSMLSVTAADIPDGCEISTMTVRDFFRAIHGFGRGKGSPASFDRAKELLLSKRVVQMKGFPIGDPERVILRELILEGGTRLHFETSARGACLYYIEERGPSCVEVVENEIHTDAAVEVSSADREEAGRDTSSEPGDSAVIVPVPDTSDTATVQQPDANVCPVPPTDSVPPDNGFGDRPTAGDSNVRM